MGITRFDYGKEGAMTHEILGHRVSSRFVAELAPIAYGTPVEQGSSDTYVTGTDSGDEAGNGASSGKFVGIAIKRGWETNECGSRCTPKVLALPKGVDFLDYWNTNEAVSVLENGSCYVRVVEDVEKGDKAFYLDSGADTEVNETDKNLTKYLGVWGKEGTEATDCVYDSSAKAGECAIIRINK